MKTIRFNTRRKYTEFGQRIVATLHDDGVVTFHDIDRMVTGEMTEKYDGHLVQSRVMEDYDHYRYTNSSRSWSDGMSRGGVNSKWEE